jgi:hypothetical protein
MNVTHVVRSKEVLKIKQNAVITYAILIGKKFLKMEHVILVKTTPNLNLQKNLSSFKLNAKLTNVQMKKDGSLKRTENANSAQNLQRHKTG